MPQKQNFQVLFFFLTTISVCILTLLEAVVTDFQNCSSIIGENLWAKHILEVSEVGFKILHLHTSKILRFSAHISINRHLKCKLGKQTSEIVVSFSVRLTQGAFKSKKLQNYVHTVWFGLGLLKSRGQLFIHSGTTHSTFNGAYQVIQATILSYYVGLITAVYSLDFLNPLSSHSNPAKRLTHITVLLRTQMASDLLQMKQKLKSLQGCLRPHMITPILTPALTTLPAIFLVPCSNQAASQRILSFFSGTGLPRGFNASYLFCLVYFSLRYPRNFCLYLFKSFP